MNPEPSAERASAQITRVTFYTTSGAAFSLRPLVNGEPRELPTTVRDTDVVKFLVDGGVRPGLSIGVVALAATTFRP